MPEDERRLWLFIVRPVLNGAQKSEYGASSDTNETQTRKPYDPSIGAGELAAYQTITIYHNCMCERETSEMEREIIAY